MNYLYADVENYLTYEEYLETVKGKKAKNKSTPNCPPSAAYAIDFEVDCDGDGVYEQMYWRPDLAKDPSDAPACARGGSGVLSASGGACTVAMCEIDAQGETSPSQKRNTAHCLEPEVIETDDEFEDEYDYNYNPCEVSQSFAMKDRLEVVCKYQDQKPKRVAIRGDLPWVMFGDPSISNSDMRSVRDDFPNPVIIEQWGDIRWKTAAYMFAGAHADIRALDAPNFQDVIDMTAMFNEFVTAGKYNIVLNWDVSNIRVMRKMFEETSFDPQIGSWNVSNVQNMRGMFRGASVFNQPLDSWDVSNVIDMSNMFEEAKAFNQPICSWNVSNVQNMRGMFGGARSFNQPIGSWNVSNVTSMQQMFSHTISFNQPIGSWNVSNVTSIT